MVIVALVTFWAVVEATIAIALVARPGSRMPRPVSASLLSGVIDWRL